MDVCPESQDIATAEMAARTSYAALADYLSRMVFSIETVASDRECEELASECADKLLSVVASLQEVMGQAADAKCEPVAVSA